MAVGITAARPYDNLTPDVVLSAVEALGYRCDGRLLALNSFENRVYQIGLEEGTPLVAKFYRPGRWSDQQILEDHAFSLELAEHEIPVVPPIANETGTTLHHYSGYRFALFPRRGGRAPELDDLDHLTWLGRFIARIHAVGVARPFQARPTLDIDGYGVDAYTFLLEHGFVPPELQRDYRRLAEGLIAQTRTQFAAAEPFARIRIHGDCHPGNILWTDTGPHFVDLDDARMGPAMQDLWMLLSGERHDKTLQLDALLEGYTEFQDFNPRELHLVEALRTLRLIHYSAWLARRWDDPAFTLNFPWFNTPHYWQEQVVILQEQFRRFDEPPLPYGAMMP